MNSATNDRKTLKETFAKRKNGLGEQMYLDL